MADRPAPNANARRRKSPNRKPSPGNGKPRHDPQPRKRRARSGATGRSAAVYALAAFAERFPDVAITHVDLHGLGDAEARLGVAIHRLGVQRWLTLSHLLGRFLKKPLDKLEPAMQAVLIGGAAQLVLMQKLPAYAVVDEMTSLAKAVVHPRAGGMANAVLRKVAGLVKETEDKPWAPARDLLPIAGGRVRLTEPCLPATANMVLHLEAALSFPRALVARWYELFGLAEAQRMMLHSLESAPTFVIENETPRLWEGSHEELVAWLAQRPDRRVQDPASLASAAATAGLGPKTVLDLCAGRGTKTRQLLALHPDAALTAWDPDADRRAELDSIAQGHENLTVAEPEGRYDLVVLDVPCTNTGVLARRPGAKYRYTPRHRRDLIQLQREIIDRALDHASPSGHLLYCTCSLDPEENRDQARYILERAAGAEIVGENTLLPGGAGPEHHDGSYHALVQLP